MKYGVYTFSSKQYINIVSLNKVMYHRISIITSVFFYSASLYYVKLRLGKHTSCAQSLSLSTWWIWPKFTFPRATRGLFFIEATCNRDHWPACVLWLMSKSKVIFRILLLGDWVFLLRRTFLEEKYVSCLNLHSWDGASITMLHRKGLKIGVVLGTNEGSY